MSHAQQARSGATTSPQDILPSGAQVPPSDLPPDLDDGPPSPPSPSQLQSMSLNDNKYYDCERLASRSSSSISTALLDSTRFILGAGMVILEPWEEKVVVLWDKQRRHWCLPRGIKEIGESLDQTAIREAFEQTGYKACLLPAWQRVNAAPPQGSRHVEAWHPTTEPLMMQTLPDASPRDESNLITGQYISWFLGLITQDHEINIDERERVSFEDEQPEPHLLTIDQARLALRSTDHGLILETAWAVWSRTLHMRELMLHKEHPCLLDGQILPSKLYLRKVMGVIANNKGDPTHSQGLEASSSDAEELDSDE